MASKFVTSFSLASVLFTTSLCAFVPYARAGFEWTPPPAAVTPTQASAQDNTPAAVPVDGVDKSMLPMPAEAVPVAAPAPVRASALPPALTPVQTPHTSAVPAPVQAQAVQSAEPQVIRTITPVKQPEPVIHTLPAPIPAPQQQAVQPIIQQPPVQQQQVQSAPVIQQPEMSVRAPIPDSAPTQAAGQAYVPKDSVTKRMRYSDWLTEAQAQEMSMKVHRENLIQNDPLEQQNTPQVVEQSTRVVMPADAPQPALDVAREQEILQQQAGPATITATELPPPAVTNTTQISSRPVQGNSDVMPLLAPEDLTISPYPVAQPSRPAPQQQQASLPPTKIVLPADAPEKTKSLSGKTQTQAAPAKKQKPPVPPATAKAKETPVAKATEKKIEPLVKVTEKPAAEPVAKAENFTGFGTDIPLAFAVEQILPEGYSFDFGDGVNPEQRVSWQGGKPWKDVVDEILKPLNLSSKIEGKTVYITRKS